MARPSPRQKRAQGLWTAAWLFVLLLAGVLRLGDLSVQWPVLLVPVLWALVALRPRRGERGPRFRREPPDPHRPAGPPDRDGLVGPPGPGGPAGPGERRPPATRELPWLPDVPRRPREE
jgi:hypothetical protein